MDVDIRKPVSHHFGIEHPNQSASASTSANLDDEESDDEDEVALKQQHEEDVGAGNEDLRRLQVAREAMEQHATEQRHDLDGQQELDHEGPYAMDVEERINAHNFFEEDDAYPIYDSDAEDASDEDLEEAKRVGGWHYRRKQLKRGLRNAGTQVYSFLTAAAPVPRPTPVPNRQDAMGIPRSSTARKRFYAPPGKRIHVPVRVEPKVFFAAERTFLSWLEFSIILGSVAGTLVNFGDDLSVSGAMGFTIVACLSLLYSMGLYLWRVDKIRKRRAVTFHDKWGPTVLCVGMVVSVGVNFGLRFGSGGFGDGALKDRVRGK